MILYRVFFILKKIQPIAFSRVTPTTCRKLIAKVVDQEESFWQKDIEIEKAKAEIGGEEVLDFFKDDDDIFNEYSEFDEI